MSRLLNNRYRLIQPHGAPGGFGQTFLAEDTQMPSRRRCIVKQFKPGSPLGAETHRLVLERFEREAAILEKLGSSCQQIPKLYAYFAEGEDFYIVQELIEGKNLMEKVRDEGVLREEAVAEILLSILPVLHYVHSEGYIHRDIKPQNIILRDADGLPVLIDFGAVKEVVTTVLDEYGTPLGTSVVFGTRGYIPREQGEGMPVPASDLYSLGFTAIYLMTGKHPFQMADPWQNQLPDISPKLRGVIEKATRPDYRERYARAESMLLALRPDAGGEATPHDISALASLLASTVAECVKDGGDELFAGTGGELLAGLSAKLPRELLPIIRALVASPESVEALRRLAARTSERPGESPSKDGVLERHLADILSLDERVARRLEEILSQSRRRPAATKSDYSNQTVNVHGGPVIQSPVFNDRVIFNYAPSTLAQVDPDEMLLKAESYLLDGLYLKAGECLKKIDGDSGRGGRKEMLEAVALIAGRSFNGLGEAERAEIEERLISARRLLDNSCLPAVLLAALEIDYYHYHSMKGRSGITAEAVRAKLLDCPLSAKESGLLRLVKVSEKAARFLGI